MSQGKVGRSVNSSRLRWVGDLMLGWDVGNLLSEWKATEDADGRALPAPQNLTNKSGRGSGGTSALPRVACSSH